MHETPLHKFHVDHGGKMVEFAGWHMPLVYSSVTEEHNQVRTSGGLFDVSHMGRVKMTGRHARKLLERLCTRKIGDMQPGQCRYSLVCNEQGGVMDDVIVMRMDDDDFLVVVNASNREKLLGHFEKVRAGAWSGGGASGGASGGEELKVKIDDHTFKTAMVAIQGPKVMEMISRISTEIPTLKRFRFATKNYVVFKLFVSRTGYTGEDGVEVILPASAVEIAMKMLFKDVNMEAADSVIKPAGLAARDTLRLEAGMPLYGHELTEETNALGTGLDFAISLDKDEGERGEKFVGMDALKRTRDEGGPRRKLVGLKLEGKRTARQGHAVKVGGKEVGVVTSAAPSPTLGCPIAMAYLDRDHVEQGTGVEIDTGKGGAGLGGVMCAMPFYKPPKR